MKREVQFNRIKLQKRLIQLIVKPRIRFIEEIIESVLEIYNKKINDLKKEIDNLEVEEYQDHFLEDYRDILKIKANDFEDYFYEIRGFLCVLMNQTLETTLKKIICVRKHLLVERSVNNILIMRSLFRPFYTAI